jgi:insulysin
VKSLKQQTLLRVFNAYLSDKLGEELEQALDAGYRIAFDGSMRGVSLELRGWSDNFDKFYGEVLKSIHEHKATDSKRFERVISNMKISLDNVY